MAHIHIHAHAHTHTHTHAHTHTHTHRYLASPGVPDRKLFNASGRGFPDIAAQATSFMVVSNLLPEPVDGTSCALTLTPHTSRSHSH